MKAIVICFVMQIVKALLGGCMHLCRSPRVMSCAYPALRGKGQHDQQNVLVLSGSIQVDGSRVVSYNPTAAARAT